CFDVYAGHSWASGDANFADGNNQESSSESLNAWYGMMLWGEATGDAKIRDLGAALFNIERTAVEEYWFDVSGGNYPKDFPNVALGMVWGGKGAFGTWFSGDVDCIHGINWLPFTPASVTMGRHPDYVKKNYERIIAQRKGGKDFGTGWGDLVVMFNALQDAEAAAGYMDEQPNCKIESGNSRAFMYQWVNTLKKLGRVDPTVTSSHPFVNVFVKDKTKTYAAYNFGAVAKIVEFSDGASFTMAPCSLTTKTVDLK
ncbi:MAG: glycosyl hydrolase, partial [Planctomycetia bacterium]